MAMTEDREAREIELARTQLQTWVGFQAVPIVQELANKKPSEIIRIAIEDLQKVRAQNMIDGVVGKIDMTLWLSVRRDGENQQPYCYACLAGCVIGNRLPLHEVTDLLEKAGGIGFDSFSEHQQIRKIMLALDSFRRGLWGSGLRYLGYDPWQLGQTKAEAINATDKHYVPYETDSDGFLSYLDQLADTLALLDM